jgi:uncharacterized protein
MPRRLRQACVVLLLTFPAPALAAKPSFDCGRALGKVEQLICSDDELAELDRKLADLHRSGGERAAAQKVAEQKWIHARNQCAQSADVRACVESLYRRRIIALQIANGVLPAAKAVGYACKGHESKPFSAAFYNETEPPSALLTFGDQKATAFVAPSGSGARYTADGVEFWEHQGEATIDWRGTKMTCAPAK